MELSAFAGGFHCTRTFEGPSTLAVTFIGVRSTKGNHSTSKL